MISNTILIANAAIVVVTWLYWLVLRALICIKIPSATSRKGYKKSFRKMFIKLGSKLFLFTYVFPILFSIDGEDAIITITNILKVIGLLLAIANFYVSVRNTFLPVLKDLKELPPDALLKSIKSHTEDLD